MTFALHSKVAHASLLFTLPPKSPVQMTNSLLLSINTSYLSIPAGGLTSNVIWGGGRGVGGGKRVKKKKEREWGGGWGGGERKHETGPRRRNWKQMAHELNHDVEA